MTMTREVMDDGAIRMKDLDGCIILSRLAPAVVLISFTGQDKGQFGDMVFAELAKEMARHGVIEIFIDTREALNALVPVTNQWSDWLHANQKGLKHVSVLVASKFVELTAGVMKLLSRTGSLMRIYTHAPSFSDAIAQMTGRPFVLGPPRT